MVVDFGDGNMLLLLRYDGNVSFYVLDSDTNICGQLEFSGILVVICKDRSIEFWIFKYTN